MFLAEHIELHANLFGGIRDATVERALDECLRKIGSDVASRSLLRGKGLQNDFVFAAFAASQAADGRSVSRNLRQPRRLAAQQIQRAVGVAIRWGAAQIAPGRDRRRQPIKKFLVKKFTLQRRGKLGSDLL